MRLLKKSEILAKQAADKRADIDQGKQLASKIDRLREIAVAEEVSLHEYRKRTIAQIQSEIEVHNKKLESLKTEISRLESDRAVGMSKVDALLEQANEKNKEYESLKDALLNKQKEIEETLDDIKTKQKQTESHLHVAEADRVLVANTLWRARNLHKKRDLILKKLLLEEKALDDNKIKIGAELIRRENELAARERDLNLKKEKLDNREHTLYEREKAVEDKYNTLLQIEKLTKK